VTKQRQKTFRVSMTTLAVVSGVAEVKADSVHEAERIALEMTGDVIWNYESLDEEAEVTVENVEEQ